MIRVTDHGEIRELRLDRPPANALSPELLARLCELVESAPGSGARALVVTGSEGMFTGGLDVPLLLGLDRAGMGAAWDLFYRAMHTLAGSSIPVAAAISGHNPGGGLVLSLFCDRRVMADGPFKLGLNEVAVGIPLPRIIFAVLRRLIGPHRAEQLAVSAELLGPEQALRLGLVDEVVPAAEVVEAALTWCRKLLPLPAAAMNATRAMARSDLLALFDRHDRAARAEELERCWYAEEAQRTLGQLARRLTQRG